MIHRFCTCPEENSGSHDRAEYDPDIIALIQDRFCFASTDPYISKWGKICSNDQHYADKCHQSKKPVKIFQNKCCDCHDQCIKGGSVCQI